jgi:hypothetical protein
MHREDNSKFLLYIEPKASSKLTTPVEDGLTKIMQYALSKAKGGTAGYSNLSDKGHGTKRTISGLTVDLPSFRPGSGYKGSHRTECGERSDNRDFLLENGFITNSLASFYLKWYRNSIPESEMTKLKELEKFYENKDN